MPPAARLRKLLAGVALVATVVLALSLVRDGSRLASFPRSNVRFHQGAYLVNAVAHGDVLDRAGVRPGDLLVALDGEPFAAILDLPDRFRGLEPGRRIVLGVVRGGRRINLPVTTWPNLRPREAAEVLFPVLVLLLLGAVVRFARPGIDGSGLFFLYCLVVALNDASQATMVAGRGLLQWAGTLAYTLLSFYEAPLLLHFFLRYPRHGPVQRRLATVLPVAYGVPLLLGFDYLLPLVVPSLADASWFPGLSRLLFRAYGLDVVACFALAAASLLETSFSREPVALRRAARLLFVGLLVRLLLELALVQVPLALRGTPLVDQFAACLLTLVIPLFVVASIVVHQFFGINVLVRHGLVYGGATLGAGLAFVVTIGFLAGVLGERWPRYDTVIVAAVAALAGLLALPLRHGVQRGVDRWLYRRGYSYRRAVGEISARLAGILDLRDAIAFLGHRLRDLLAPASFHVLVFAPEEAGRATLYDGEGNDSAVTDAAVLRELRARLGAGSFSLVADLPGLAGPEFPSLVVPIPGGEAAAGALLLGPRPGGVPYLPEDVEFLGTIASVTGTTVERARLLAERSLRERLALVGAATSALVHELKNPLAAMRSTAAVIRRRFREDPTGQELARIVEAEIDRLEDCVVNVLSYVRPRRARHERVELAPLLGRLVDLVAPEFRGSRVRVTLRVEDRDLAVRGDEEQLRQLFLNLLMNGREAQPRGGRIDVSLRRWLGADGALAGAEIVVRDRGFGFSPESLARAFEPFYTTKRLGTGLGMVNVRRIVEQHGGTIELDNHPEGGALVTVRLPLRGDGHERECRSADGRKEA